MIVQTIAKLAAKEYMCRLSADSIYVNGLDLDNGITFCNTFVFVIFSHYFAVSYSFFPLLSLLLLLPHFHFSFLVFF